MRSFLKQYLIPPGILALARHFKSRMSPPVRHGEWHGVYDSFSDVPDVDADDVWRSDAWVAHSRANLSKVATAQADGVPALMGSSSVAALLNEWSKDGVCRVLDFAGGTGRVYHELAPGLRFVQNIRWHVVDNPSVTALGEAFRSGHDNLSFSNDFDETFDDIDVLLISVVLQYVDDYESLLASALKHKPKRVIMHPLYAGDIPTFVSAEYVMGHRVASWFMNISDLTGFMHDHGYKTTYLSATSKMPGDRFFDIPESHQLTHTATLALERIDGE